MVDRHHDLDCSISVGGCAPRYFSGIRGPQAMAQSTKQNERTARLLAELETEIPNSVADGQRRRPVMFPLCVPDLRIFVHPGRPELHDHCHHSQNAGDDVEPGSDPRPASPTVERVCIPLQRSRDSVVFIHDSITLWTTPALKRPNPSAD